MGILASKSKIMENKIDLISYYNKLCSTLNKNGFRHRMKFKGEIEELEYSVDEEMPEITITEIAENKNAYEYLTSLGLIRNDICHFCGKEPITGKHTFTEPQNNIKVNICASCHNSGINEQKAFGIENKKNTGCLLFIIPFIGIVCFVLVLIF